MAGNEALAGRFEAMAQMMDLLGEDSFRAAAHARAARTLADLPQDAAAMSRAELLAIQGIGPEIADKIQEYAASGAIAELDDLARKVPPGLLVLLRVPGLGPKTVRAMWTQLSIVDLPGLDRAIADGSLAGLPRMGEKAVAKIRDALLHARSGQQRLWLGRAYQVAELFLERLREHPGVERACEAGSLRRGKETIGDIDLLVALRPGHDADAAAIGERFRTTPGVVGVLAAGDTKSSVRYALEHDLGRWKPKDDESSSSGPVVQVDLRVLPRARWGSALLYFTGSKEHNVRLRERAQKMDLTLNEWGLFPEDNQSTPPQERAVKAIASASEEEVYNALNLEWIPPEMHEDRGEIALAEELFARKSRKKADRAIRLVDVADIKAELHAHTTASDGSLSIDELAANAKARGFHTIAVTDHSQSATVANGLRPDRLRIHIAAVRAAAARVKGITILAGSEVDIRADGTLDYDDELLAALDVVVASPHTALSQDSSAATERTLRAIAHPLVHIMGHPTGRLINRRKGLEQDFAAIIKAALTHNVALEINAHWMRLDLRDIHVRAAVDAGCLIAINCDVHAPEDFANLTFGVSTARRGWCPPELCINTWEAKKLHAWLKSKRGASS